GEPGRVVGLATASGAVRAVRTADGQLIPVDAVVCCAGRWTPEAVALAGAAPLWRAGAPGSARRGRGSAHSPDRTAAVGGRAAAPGAADGPRAGRRRR